MGGMVFWNNFRKNNHIWLLEGLPNWLDIGHHHQLATLEDCCCVILVAVMLPVSFAMQPGFSISAFFTVRVGFGGSGGFVGCYRRDRKAPACGKGQILKAAVGTAEYGIPVVGSVDVWAPHFLCASFSFVRLFVRCFIR